MPEYYALETKTARALQAGGQDANGQTPQRSVSDGNATPCRHCLHDSPHGDEMLILSYRPFEHLHPYAETGPIFLCAAACAPWQTADGLPPILTTSPDYLVKGYCATGTHRLRHWPDRCRGANVQSHRRHS